MSIDFSFHYVCDEPDALEVKEVSSEEFNPLFDFTAEYLTQLGFMDLSFVREYREQRQTLQEWMESKSPEEMQEWVNEEPPDEDDWDESDEYWSSSPFDPAEANAWANGWIMMLENLTNEQLLGLFPLTRDLQTNKSWMNTETTIKALHRVIVQAECAMKHDIQMTVDMTIG
jgi:hypothetical protein